MAEIEFSNDEKEFIVSKLKKYFERELDQEITQFEAEFLIDFFSKEVGGYYYNKGLSDAQDLINLKLDDVIYELEKPTESSR
jgi:uncharacterized protein (DUF2164 family)|tara:strand:- start:8 stop:253 length:246 start_codon:yes stop_codon:yes gene_type:complete